MAQEDERRSYFRIHDHLVLDFRQITPEEFDVLKDVVGSGAVKIPDDEKASPFSLHKSLNPENQELHTYIRIMNQKLDMIIGLLSNGNRDACMQNAQTDVSLCGSGIQFNSSAPLAVNDYVEVKMVVPVFPYPRITILCQVVRTEAMVEENARHIFKIATKFLVINENDQDFLVKYIFEKEREQLRQEREDLG